MDTSETYIKMCDCPEIQETSPPPRMGDIWAYTRAKLGKRWGIEHNAPFVYYISNNYGGEPKFDFIVADKGGNSPEARLYKTDDIYRVWLPRQDQLQEMVDIQVFDNPTGYVRSHVLAKEFWQYVDKSYSPYTNYNSMEQLWLAFVMKEKGKVWDGDCWVENS